MAPPRALPSSAPPPAPPCRLQARKAPTGRVVATQASPMELAQVAGEASFIAGTAFTMVGMTLVVSTIGRE